MPVEHVVVDLEETHERDHMLVVGSQTIVGEPLLAAIRERAAQSAVEVTLVAPADEVGVERRLEEAVRRLRDAGVDATGHLGDGDPYSAVMNAVHDEGADEIVTRTTSPVIVPLVEGENVRG